MRFMLALASRRLDTSADTASWGLAFQARSAAVQRHVRLYQRESLGTICLHLSALEIQRYWRRFAVRLRGPHPNGSRRVLHSAASAKLAGLAPTAPFAGPVPTKVEINLVSKYLDTKRAMRDLALRDALTYRDWCASRVQAWWRMCPLRRAWLSRRWTVFFVAARSVQRWWLEHLLSEVAIARGFVEDPLRTAAKRIQACWRSFSSRRIMRYFVDLIKFREQGNPGKLLRSINPREAGLLDSATGAHVRFRLGGLEWPPKVYYKIYTHASVTDICAFAPRDYTRAKQLVPRKLHNKPLPNERRVAETREGWYRRVENNGWRPVQESLLRELDFVTVSTSATTVPFAPTKVQRREDVAQKRRQKKIDWLRKMYKDRGAEGAHDRAAQAAAGEDVGDGHEVDALLQWTDDLDFDSYHDNWLTLATTGHAKHPSAADLDDLGDGGAHAFSGGAGTNVSYDDSIELMPALPYRGV